MQLQKKQCTKRRKMWLLVRVFLLLCMCIIVHVQCTAYSCTALPRPCLPNSHSCSLDTSTLPSWFLLIWERNENPNKTAAVSKVAKLRHHYNPKTNKAQHCLNTRCLLHALKPNTEHSWQQAARPRRCLALGEYRIAPDHANTALGKGCANPLIHTPMASTD